MLLQHKLRKTKRVDIINGVFLSNAVIAQVRMREMSEDRGSRTVRLRIEGNRRQGHDVYPGSGPLDGGNTLLPA